jgi:dihydrofolate reductase
MRKLIVGGFVSLDGVTDKPWEWVGSFYDDQVKQHSLKKLREADLFFVGRKTYERFSSTWPAIKGDEYFDTVNSMKKVVASNTLTIASWNAQVIGGDVVAEIKALKELSGKNILKYGIGDVDKPLLENRLIDEFHFSCIPVVVQKGRRFFEGINLQGIKLNLKDTHVFDNGVVFHSYIPIYEKQG